MGCGTSAAQISRDSPPGRAHRMPSLSVHDSLCNVPAPTQLSGKRVIELGSGTGVVGIGVALLGAEVWLTDLWDNIDIMDANVDTNFSSRPVGEGNTQGEAQMPSGRVHVAELDWNWSEEELHQEGFSPPFEMVIGTYPMMYMALLTITNYRLRFGIRTGGDRSTSAYNFDAVRG